MNGIKWRTKIIILFAMMILFGLNTVWAADESYVTKNYDVRMDVNGNNTFLVQEDIKVDFTEPRHGIYRYIPYKGTITRQVDGSTVDDRYRMKISDVKVEGYQFDTDTENGNLVIRIGSEDENVNGPQEYRISYRCTLYDDENTAFDSVYWNLLPQGWPTSIEASTMTVHMPKAFAAGSVELIAGRSGQADMKSVEWTVNDNTITARTTRTLAPDEGVTLNLVLPEGYFTGEKTMDWMLWVMTAIIIITPLLSILLWFLFGRDPKVVKTVEFYPPEGINSAELGYIIDGTVDSKDIVSLIIYWANGGWLTIQEEEKDEFILRKEKELPADAKTYEQTMFNGLFSGRDQVSMKELKEDFYGTFEATKNQLKANFTMRMENRIFTQSSLGARAVGILLMLPPLASLCYFGIFLNRSSDAVLSYVVMSAILAVIGFGMLIVVFDKRESLTKGKVTGLNFAGIIAVVLSALGAIAFSYYALGNILLGITVVLASLVSLVFTMRMKRRTKKSSRQLGQILGFKEFIRTAELDRIKRLVEETPNYFYNVLPYAYVFGLTDKWAKKFENIAVEPPGWYYSGYGNSMFNTWIFMNSFHHYTNAIQQNISVPPASSGGTGGGSFSGGGGFSGGGFGGGGGGSW
jgi:uncharacterized membrane protein YgcG